MGDWLVSNGIPHRVTVEKHHQVEGPNHQMTARMVDSPRRQDSADCPPVVRPMKVITPPLRLP